MNIEDISLVNYIPETGSSFYIPKKDADEIIKVILKIAEENQTAVENNNLSDSKSSQRISKMQINNNECLKERLSI